VTGGHVSVHSLLSLEKRLFMIGEELNVVFSLIEGENQAKARMDTLQDAVNRLELESGREHEGM